MTKEAEIEKGIQTGEIKGVSEEELGFETGEKKSVLIDGETGDIYKKEGAAE